jgi:hypothetical protein
MRTGACVLLVAVVLALGFGPRRTFVDGRFQGAHRVHDVDAEHHLELVRRLGVTDAPTKAQVQAALAAITQ